MILASSTLSFIFFAVLFSFVAFFASILIIPLVILSFLFAGLVVVFNGLSYFTFRLASSEYNHTVLFLNRAMRNLADNLPPSVGVVEVGKLNKSTFTNTESPFEPENIVEQEGRFSFKSIVERYINKAKYFPLLISRKSKEKEEKIEAMSSLVESVIEDTTSIELIGNIEDTPIAEPESNVDKEETIPVLIHEEPTAASIKYIIQDFEEEQKELEETKIAENIESEQTIKDLLDSVHTEDGSAIV